MSKCAQVEPRMEPSLCRCLEQHPQSSSPPIFVGLRSIGWFVPNSFFLQVCSFACSMGFMKNPEGMLKVLKAVLEATNNRAVLLTAAYLPLDLAIITTFEHAITQHLLPQVNSRWPFSLGTHSRHKEIGFAVEWSIFGLFSKGIFTQKCSGYDGFIIPDNSSTWCNEEFSSRGGLRLAIFGMISA